MLHVYVDASMDEPILSCGYVVTRTDGVEETFVDSGCRIINTDEVRPEIDYCANRGEYRALITAVRSVLSYTSEPLVVYSDSDVVVEEVRGNRDSFEPYFRHAALSFLGRFTDYHIIAIDRERNELAHEQARIGLKLGRDLHESVGETS